MFSELLAYPRAFKVLFVSALIENTAFGLLLPYLAIYMVTEVKVSEVLTGVVLMGYTLSGIPSMIFGGMLADKIGRRTVLLTSLGLMSFTVMMYFFAFDFWSLFAIALVDSFVGTMYMPAANAMIADVIPPAGRPRAYSILRIGWNVGIIFGPFMGFIIVASTSISVLFLFGAGILFSAFIMNLFFIPETKPKETGEEITFRKVIAVASNRPFLLLCSLSGMFWFFFSQWMSVLPIYATNPEMLNISKSLFGVLFAVSAIMVVFFQVPLTARLERRRRSSVLMTGQLIAAAGFGLVFFAWDFYSLVACIIVITTGELFYMSVISTIIADFAPEDRRGIFMGFSGMVQTIGNGVGFFFGMWLLDFLPNSETRMIWLVFMAIGLAASVGYVPYRRIAGPKIDNAPSKPQTEGKFEGD
jgi:MFS family permease